MSTVPFVFTQCNVGDHFTFADLAEVCSPMNTTVTSLNEMYNRRMQKLLDRLLEMYPRLGVVEFPDVEGARANPLVYDTHLLDLKDAQCYKVLESGTRAGKHNMQKNLVGGVFQFKPVPCRMNLFGKHSIQTQQPKPRERAAIQQNENEVDRLDWRDAITMVGGDWNAVPGDPSLRPYAGWASTQRADPTDTFGHRNIDGVMWHGPRHIPGVQCAFQRNTVVKGTRSDHLPIRAHFEIKVKPWQ